LLNFEIQFLDSDVELAPSDNPTTSTYFASMLRLLIQKQNFQFFCFFLLEQTKESIQQPISTIPNDDIKQNSHRTPLPSSSISPNRSRDLAHVLQKHSNSCSTIYVDDSTVSQPNWKAMIKCVSIAIHSHILHRKSNKTMNIFDEKLHPLTVCLVYFVLEEIFVRFFIIERSNTD
jgi:hypothetical protein